MAAQGTKPNLLDEVVVYGSGGGFGVGGGGLGGVGMGGVGGGGSAKPSDAHVLAPVVVNAPTKPIELPRIRVTAIAPPNPWLVFVGGLIWPSNGLSGAGTCPPNCYGALPPNSVFSEETKTPNKGEPETWHKNPGSGQDRLYGEDGKPVKDIDWDHDHGQGIPHVHDWDRDQEGNPVRGPGRPFNPDIDIWP